MIQENKGLDEVEYEEGETGFEEQTEESAATDIETEETETAVESEIEADIDEGLIDEPAIESEPENRLDESVAESEPEIRSKEEKVIPYHERYYLKYREGKRNAPLDLVGTRDFLKKIGFDGGELKQARERKNCAENLRSAEKKKGNQMYCSYCGSEISGVEFFRLPDGRIRCNMCSNTIVKTKSEVEGMCKIVMANMDSFFGAAIDVPVSIEVTDERKIKKKVGVPLDTRDSQSMLILGVAFDKKQKYSIILENGAPRISLIATFAHELTHIWQYVHWDHNKNFKKPPLGNRLPVYEGMAKWAEIQYLYLVGEKNVAKREEEITRNRDDEYGEGFRLYEERYPLTREAMMCDETPFNSNKYPLD